jgi:serine/threonine-protein kinase
LALQPGELFGAYEIVAPIGHGGMGEVYAARDLKLRRVIALKVLPDSIAADPDRVARFKREAEVLASLSHPNIGAIFGLAEEAGRNALVLELIAGPTLADRLTPGPMPLDEALTIARQIATALEAAHERGVIHRDLKPSNIKVGTDGIVKVLDFGLAKLSQPTEPGRAPDLSQSPTITSPAIATHAGVILGTATYMSPEQAKGKPIDRRSDMWAFGCVLYEMLTGKRAFAGEDVSDTLAEVLKSEPDWGALPADTPESLRRLLRRCLAKDRVARLSDAATARLEIDDAKHADAPYPRTSHAARVRMTWLVPSTAVVFLAAVVALLLQRQMGNVERDNRVPTRFRILLPGAFQTAVGATLPSLALSQDGRRIAFSLGRDASDTNWQLWIQDLSQLEANPLRGTEGATGPFFSPDGEWVAYFDTTRGLRKIRLDAGAGVPISITNTSAGVFRGGSWGPDGTIVFASSASLGLMRVPHIGGAAQPLTQPSNEVHTRPYFFPDGRALVYTSQRPGSPSQIVLLVPDSGETRLLAEGEEPRISAQGFLIFRRNAALWVAPLDLQRRALAGEPVPLVEGVRGGVFDVAANGTLVYTPPRDALEQRNLVWVDRQGAESSTNLPPRAYVYPRISPDATQFALDIRDQQNDIWVWHTVRQTLTRLTFNTAMDRFPVWTHDGKRVAFTTEGFGLSWQTSDGSGIVERLSNPPKTLQSFQGANNAFPTSFSLDGKTLLFWGNGSTDILTLQLAPTRDVAALFETPSNERNGEISPDGRWLAFESNESGIYEIHVRPFPDVTRGKWQISTNGGTQPVWDRSGRLLYFRSPSGALMEVPVETSKDAFSTGIPKRLFEGPYFRNAVGIVGRTYDVAPDGRFLMVKEDTRRAQTNDYLIAVENAFADLKLQK